MHEVYRPHIVRADSYLAIFPKPALRSPVSQLIGSLDIGTPTHAFQEGMRATIAVPRTSPADLMNTTFQTRLIGTGEV
ncbi:hypothetical protein [Phyllobacterium sp. CCNWLW11]|uniref:hypothetical protein n=1 Tax=unclassified Phyllobacterium TaxID=2638441 RepID=UPI003FA77F5B